jgi:hypothetical protein
MITKLPPGIKRLFGKPLVLPKKDLRVYNKFLLQTANAASARRAGATSRRFNRLPLHAPRVVTAAQ